MVEIQRVSKANLSLDGMRRIWRSLDRTPYNLTAGKVVLNICG